MANSNQNGSEFMGKKLHVQKREIHRRPQIIGVPAGHRSQRETSLTTQGITERGVPNTTPQYPLVQQYQFQPLAIGSTPPYSNSIRMDKMDPERRFSITNPMIPVVPQFHVMNYHNHVSSPPSL